MLSATAFSDSLDAAVPGAAIIVPVLLLLVTAQRLLELVIARRNTRRLLAAGGHEIGQAHYPLIVALHSCWLAALWVVWLSGNATLSLLPLIAYLLVQPLRIWVMCSLGRFWTTRIIVVPTAPLVRRGPYRFLRHPNYLIVVMEIALLPLALGVWPLALLFSLANAVVLWIRLTAEAASLRQRLAISR
jgi:methyltransferase